MRDDFPNGVKKVLKERAGNVCSHCGAPTSGPQDDPNSVLNVGVAAHITAASTGGPRYDASLTIAERGAASNGIWLCQICAKLVDNDIARFGANQLRQLKHGAEAGARDRIGKPNAQLETYGALKISLHQLPPPPNDFTGRSKDIEELFAAVRVAGVAISGMHGMGGVGKTALALKFAEEMGPTYPDAQFYVDLKGTSEQPLTAAEVMAHIIRAFDPTATVPEDQSARSGMYQSLLHGKKTILLLDNARDATHVSPLIPPKSSLLIVTSRQHFTLPGVAYKNIEALSADEATDLLRLIAPRIAEGDATKLAQICAGLPLALRAVGSALAIRPDLQPRHFAEKLADNRQRLKLTEVEASLSASYNLLSPEDQVWFRELAVFPGTFASIAAGAIWGSQMEPPEDTLGRLLRFSLLEFDRVVSLYKLHDLVRLFADARLEPEDRFVVKRRHALHYRGILDFAARLYEQGGSSAMKGLAVIDVERGNVWAARAWAEANLNADITACHLAAVYPIMVPSALELRQDAREAVSWSQVGLIAANRLNDKQAEAKNHGHLASRFIRLGDYKLAIENANVCLEISRILSDRTSEAAALSSLGAAYFYLSQFRKVIEHEEQALRIAREESQARAEVHILGNLAVAHRRLGENSQATERFTEQLQIARKLGLRREEARALGNLATLSATVGDRHRALDLFHQALPIYDELKDKHGLAVALAGVGNIHLQLGEPASATEPLERSLAMAREIGDRGQEVDTLGVLGTASMVAGDARSAIKFLQQSLDLARSIGDRYHEGKCLGNIGIIFDQIGQTQRAIEYFEERLKVAREIEDPEGEAHGLFSLGRAYSKLGNQPEAKSNAEAALEIFEQIHSPFANGVRTFIAGLA